MPDALAWLIVLLYTFYVLPACYFSIKNLMRAMYEYNKLGLPWVPTWFLLRRALTFNRWPNTKIKVEGLLN